MKRITDGEYFSYQALSKSQIKQYTDRNPMAFWQQCIFNPNKQEDKITDALVQGQLAHCLLLEPQNFEKNFKIMEDVRGFSSRNTKAFQEAIAREPKILVLRSEYNDWDNRIKILKSYDVINNILTGAKTEQPYIWEDNGIELKAKLDCIRNTEKGIVIIEYKTTSNLEKNIKGIDVGGYIHDVGMQCKVVEKFYQQTPVQMLFIIQSSKEGEEHMIDVRAVEKEDIEICRNYTDMIIEKIKQRLSKGLCDESFKTDVKIKGFEGYQDTAFSLSFDKQCAEMEA